MSDRIGTEVKILGGNDPWAQGQVFKTVEQLHATIASQAAQIERLREALITIAGPSERDPDLPPIYQPRWSVEQCRYIARAALQPKEDAA